MKVLRYNKREFITNFLLLLQLLFKVSAWHISFVKHVIFSRTPEYRVANIKC